MKLQQGDVILRDIDKIPDGSEIQDNLILAYGSATGHKHQIIAGKAELWLKDDKMYLSVLSDSVKLVHDEHKSITILQGNWSVTKVMEYDHFAEEAREVRD